jgi:hypothetical protein
LVLNMTQTRWSLEAALSSIWQGDIKALLLASTYSQQPDDRYVADVKESEITVEGYSRKTVENLSVEIDEQEKIVSRKADPLVWTDLNLGSEKVGTVVIYKDAGDDAKSEIIDFLSPREISTNNEILNLTLNFDATGVGFIRYEVQQDTTPTPIPAPTTTRTARAAKTAAMPEFPLPPAPPLIG